MESWMRTTLLNSIIVLGMFGVLFLAHQRSTQLDERTALLAQREAEVAQLKARNTRLADHNRRLHDEVLALHDEPASVERRARDEYAFAYPDEVVLVFDSEAPDGATVTAALDPRPVAAPAN